MTRPGEKLGAWLDVATATKVAGIYIDSFSYVDYLPLSAAGNGAAVLVEVSGDRWLVYQDGQASSWLATSVAQNDVCGVVPSTDESLCLGSWDLAGALVIEVLARRVAGIGSRRVGLAGLAA